MSAEENKELYLRAVEAANRGDIEASVQVTAPDATLNGEPFGREGDRQRSEAMAAAFPDVRFDIEEMVAEDDKLVVRWRMTGTHQGELIGGPQPIPPTGKHIDVWGMSLYRFEEGMIKEIWERFDMMEFLGQLGVMDSSQEPSEEASPT